MAFHKLLFICTLVYAVLGFPQRENYGIPQIRPAFTTNLYQKTSRSDSSIVTPPAIDVNETVKEVELLLEKNPNLPRLTRGEILDIIDNITKSDAQRTQKALMLVMPYTPTNENSANIEDLYTKAPVTQIIGSETSTTSSPKETTTRKPYYKTTKQTQRTRKTTEGPTTTLSNHDIPSDTTPVYVPTSTIRSTRRPKPNRGVQKYFNHKYSAEESNGSNVVIKEGIRIVDPPLRTTSRPIDSDTFKIAVTKPKPVYQVKLITTTGKPELTDIIPDHFKDVVRDMDLMIEEPEKPFVPSKYSSQYDANNGFKPKTQPPMRENVKDILASIGLHPEAITSTTTTTTLAPAFSVADSLSPDMRELLRSFGLLPETGDLIEKPKSAKIVEETPYVAAQINPDSYVSFKPLPDSAPTRDDMNVFLSGFGLGTGRSQKSMKSTKDNKESSSQISVDMIPENFHGILKDIGITDETGKPIAINKETERMAKRIRSESTENMMEKSQHVFNPSEPPYATNDEMEKLEKLLNVIKKLENLNRTATQDDLNSEELENIRELTASLNNGNNIPLDEQDDGPNPLNFDNSFEKNEVKRQEEKVSTEISPTASATTLETLPESVTTTPTTEETRNPSFSELEESFGGPSASGSSSTTSAPLPTDPPTQPPRRTGFYYLLDWNSFLDVDNQKGKRVNLRFSPRVGDPSRFIPVKVP